MTRPSSPLLANTDTGKIYQAAQWHSSGVSRMTSGDVAALAPYVVQLTCAVGKVNGQESALKAANAALRLLIYDKTFALATSATGIPEEWFQHTGPITHDATDLNRRLWNVSNTYTMDPTGVSASTTVGSFTATNWTDWLKQEQLNNLTSNVLYDGIYQDLNGPGGFVNSITVRPADCTWSAGGTTLFSPSAPFNSTAVGGQVRMYAADGATLISWNKPGGGTTTFGSVLSVAGDGPSGTSKTLTFDSTVALPAVGNAGPTPTAKVQCTAWDAGVGAPYTEATYYSKMLGPHDATEYAYVHGSPAFYVQNNAMVDGDTFQGTIKGFNVWNAGNCDQMMMEHWMRGDNDPYQFPKKVADSTHQGFANNLQSCLDVQQAGIGVVAYARLISPTDPAAWTLPQYKTWKDWAAAAYMICNRGALLLNLTRDGKSSGDTVAPASILDVVSYTTFQINLGAPLDSSYTGSDYIVSSGTSIHTPTTDSKIYFRRFTTGAVVISLDESTTRTLTFDRSYSDWLTTTNYGFSTSIAPNSFLILSTSTPPVLGVTLLKASDSKHVLPLVT